MAEKRNDYLVSKALKTFMFASVLTALAQQGALYLLADANTLCPRRKLARHLPDCRISRHERRSQYRPISGDGALRLGIFPCQSRAPVVGLPHIGSCVIGHRAAGTAISQRYQSEYHL